MPIAPSTGNPALAWKARTAALVCLPKIPVTGSAAARRVQVLLRPDDQVAGAAALQQRVRVDRPVAETGPAIRAPSAPQPALLVSCQSHQLGARPP